MKYIKIYYIDLRIILESDEDKCRNYLLDI